MYLYRVSGCVLILTCFVCVFGKHLAIKETYCKDPDTGTLHPLNSTWSSTSFCGNYHCKLKKKKSSTDQNLKVINNISSIESKKEINKEVHLKPETNKQTLKKYITKSADSNKLSKNEDNNTNSQNINVKLNDKIREHNKFLRKNENNTTNSEKVSVKSDNKTVKHNNTILNISKTIEDMKQAGSENRVFIQKELHFPTIPYPSLRLVQSETSENKVKEKPNAVAAQNTPYDKDSYLNGAEIRSISQLLRTVKKSELQNIAEVYHLAKQIFNGEGISPAKFSLMNDINQKVNQNQRTRLNFGSHFYEPMLDKGSVDLKDVAEIAAIPATTVPLQKQDTPNPHKDANFTSLQSTHSTLSNSSHVNNSNHVAKLSNRPSLHDICEKKVYMPYSFTNILRNDVEPSNGLKLQQEKTVNNIQSPLTIKQDIDKHENTQQDVNGASSQENSILDYNLIDTTPKSNVVKKLLLKKFENTARIPWHMHDFNTLIHNTNSNKPILTPVKTNFQRIGKVIKLDNLTRQKRNNDVKPLVLAGVEYESFIERIVCPISTEPGYYRLGNFSKPFPQCCPQKIEFMRHDNVTSREVFYYVNGNKSNDAINVTSGQHQTKVYQSIEGDRKKQNAIVITKSINKA